jgi:hypothetical protein
LGALQKKKEKEDKCPNKKREKEKERNKKREKLEQPKLSPKLLIKVGVFSRSKSRIRISPSPLYTHSISICHHPLHSTTCHTHLDLIV